MPDSVAPPSPARRQTLRTLAHHGAIAATRVLPGSTALWGIPFAPHATATTSGAAAWPPPSMALEYVIDGQRSGMAIRASGGLRWQCNAHRYRAELSMVALVIFRRTQVSSGAIDMGHLEPSRFEDHQRRIQHAEFDAALGRVRYGSGAERDWPAGGQDRVSLLLSLGPLVQAAMARGETRISLPVSDAKNWQLWTYALSSTETVSTPVGPIPAIRLQRTDAHRREQDTEIWLAPSLHMLPVRLRIHEANGDVADQRLKAHTPLPALP